MEQVIDQFSWGLSISSEHDVVDHCQCTSFQDRQLETSLDPEAVECIICADSFSIPDATRVPCGHFYCTSCIALLVQHATNDQSLFPPACCDQDIDVESIKSVVPEDIINALEAKREEFTTANKLYCSNTQCTIFVSSGAISGEIATCAACNHQTCILCRNAIHEGPCPEDLDMKTTLEVADAAGWRRCDGCQEMIERDYGCNHMTCLCGHEFCYICGARWGECECPLFDGDD